MDKRERLNQLGVEWYNTPREGNEAVRADLQEQIFLLAMELFPRQEDAMGLFFLTDWIGRGNERKGGEETETGRAKAGFDPNKGLLYNYLQNRLNKRMIDLRKGDSKGADRRVSLDTPLGEGEDDGTLKDIIPGDGGADHDRQLCCREAVMELMLLMLRLEDSLEKKANNPTRINYYRLFFTDGIVDAIHTGLGPAPFAQRERELFEVMKVTFLDFFMSRPCRTAAAIADAGLKPYGQMVAGQPMSPPKQPLPNDVYTTYLKQVERYSASPSAVSQQRGHYESFLKERLQC